MQERLKTVEGTYNLRDVGGYRAGSSTTKWGTLFRSDGLHRLTSAGVEAIADLGITRVVDLRDELERTRQPDALPDTFEQVAHPIFPSALAHVSGRFTIYDLTEMIYIDHAVTTVNALDVIAQSDAPTLVHCTAGKDRTGAVITLALSAVGVDRDDVLHDFAQTEEHLRGEWLDNHLASLRTLKLEITDEVYGLVSSSPVDALERALHKVEQEYGSIEQYLIDHGATELTLERLHERLVS